MWEFASNIPDRLVAGDVVTIVDIGGMNYITGTVLRVVENYMGDMGINQIFFKADDQEYNTEIDEYTNSPYMTILLQDLTD